MTLRSSPWNENPTSGAVTSIAGSASLHRRRADRSSLLKTPILADSLVSMSADHPVAGARPLPPASWVCIRRQSTYCGLAEHAEAGATQVCLQVLNPDAGASDYDALEPLAP